MITNPISAEHYYQSPSEKYRYILDRLGCEIQENCLSTIAHMGAEYEWNFLLLSAIKYLWRAGQKESAFSDLKKAKQFLTWEDDNQPYYTLREVINLIDSEMTNLTNQLNKIPEMQNDPTKLVKIKKLHRLATAPEYAHIGDSGADLKSVQSVEIEPGGWELVSTGIAIELPLGKEAQIRSRSGLAAKHGISVLNSPGTIDNHYRGEIKVILMNNGAYPYQINVGDKIAQMVIADVCSAFFMETETELSETDRGEGGFGSTGF